MMVDLGGGARERFQSLSVEEHEGALPPLSTVEYYAHTHPGSRCVSWRPPLQDQDISNRQELLESVPQSHLQIKSDPENQSVLCSDSSSSSMMTLSGPSVSTAEEDARARGQLLQEITRVAETFEPYSSSPVPGGGCYRNYSLSDAPSHTDYIFADTPQWCWNRSPTDERNLNGQSGGSLFMGSGPPNETVINSLQYNVPSHLMPDAFSSPLPPISVAQPSTSVPSCSPVQRPPPPPVPSSTLTSSSALDLSPGPPSTAHQLPPLQPLIMPPASTHMPIDSTPPPSVHHQLPALITLDVPSQALSAHETLDDTLDLVGVEEGPGSQERMVPEYECGECGAVFTRLPHLKYHMKAHTEDLENVCNKQVNNVAVIPDSPSSKFTVPSSEKLFSCKHCDEKFSRAEKLKTHELKHAGDRPFRCNECGTAFPAKAMLIRHKKVHTGEKPYKCDICKTCFTEAGSLKVHKRLHSGEKPFKCDQCDVAFNGAGMLATHKRKHTGERPYMCDECGETFRLLSTLKSHRRRHTGEKPFVCELCGSSFTQRAAMQRHKRIHSDQKPWECEQCGYKFREKENLRKHIALHKIKLQHMCNICGAGFNQAKKLETHKMLHNGGDRPYQCNKCPSTFTNPKYLTQHKKRVHDRKGAIKCEECNGTFKRKETLRSHMRIHKGERPYVCEECGAAFNQRGTLTKHIRVHGSQVSGSENQNKDFETKSRDSVHLDKVYDLQSLDDRRKEDDASSCPLCSLNFQSQKELVRHVRSSHPAQRSSQGNSGSELDVDDSSEHIRDKYICEDCDQTFFRRRQLKAHKKYCPCRCPTYLSEPAEEIGMTPVQNDTKEVDAMKLLTAVLAVTGNNPSEVSDLHQPPVSREQPSTAPSVSSHLASSSSVTSNMEDQCPDQRGSPHLFSTCDSHYTENLHIRLKDSHLEQSSQPLHLPQTQRQHILHQSSQGHLQQCTHSQISLQHLPQDHLQQSSHIQPSDHQPSHIHQLSSQDFETLHHPSQHTSHLEQSSHPQDHIHHQTHQHDPEQSSRQHGSLQQEVTERDSLQFIHRQYTNLQEPLKEHILHTTGQDPPHPSTRLRSQTQNSEETQLLQSCHGANQHQSHLRQNHVQHQHLHIDPVIHGQFYKSTSISLPIQHMPNNHNLPHHHQQSDQNTHLQEHLHQTLPDIDDCDNLAPSLQHQSQEEADNCHHHHCHNQHLPQHYDENDLEEQSNSDLHLHHSHHHHHHLQQQNPFHSTLEDPDDIKIENIIS